MWVFYVCVITCVVEFVTALRGPVTVECVSCAGGSSELNGVIGGDIKVLYTFTRNFRLLQITYNGTQNIIRIMREIVNTDEVSDKRLITPHKLSGSGVKRSIEVTLTKLSLNDNNIAFGYRYVNLYGLRRYYGSNILKVSGDVSVKCVSCAGGGSELNGVVGKQIKILYTFHSPFVLITINYNGIQNKIVITQTIVNTRKVTDKRLIIPHKLSGSGETRSLEITLTKLSLNDNNIAFDYVYTSDDGDEYPGSNILKVSGDVIVECVSCPGRGSDLNGVVHGEIKILYTFKSPFRLIQINYNGPKNRIVITPTVVNTKQVTDKRFTIPERVSGTGNTRSIEMILTTLSLNDNNVEFDYTYTDDEGDEYQGSNVLRVSGDVIVKCVSCAAGGSELNGVVGGNVTIRYTFKSLFLLIEINYNGAQNKIVITPTRVNSVQVKDKRFIIPQKLSGSVDKRSIEIILTQLSLNDNNVTFDYTETEEGGDEYMGSNTLKVYEAPAFTNSESDSD